LDANEQPFGEFRGMALTIYIYKTKTPENWLSWFVFWLPVLWSVLSFCREMSEAFCLVGSLVNLCQDVQVTLLVCFQFKHFIPFIYIYHICPCMCFCWNRVYVFFYVPFLQSTYYLCHVFLLYFLSTFYNHANLYDICFQRVYFTNLLQTLFLWSKYSPLIVRDSEILQNAEMCLII
jgi:hypothetical protein